MTPHQKVLLISNRPRTGKLWVYGLQQENFSVVLEQAPAKSVQRWNDEIPDLIIIDINSPATQVIQIIKRLRNETITPIILLSQLMTDDHVLDAYQAGVDECIPKPFNPSIFIAKVKVWLRRSGTIPIGTLHPLRAGRMKLHPVERTIQIIGSKPVKLTNLELRLTYSLMSKADRTLGSEELIQQIWGYTADGDHATLKNLVYRLRRKIESDPARPRMIKTMGNTGYRLVSE